jgi:acyl-CoA synthetase (AMP-forming)/AMP-acid ligase II
MTVREGRRVPFPSRFWQLIEDTAAAHPDRPLVSDDYGRTFTTLQFRDAALEVAAGLAGFGIGADTVVSWQLPSRVESLVLLAALARLDAVQNPIIPVMREREVRYITGEVDTDFLLVPTTWRGFDHETLARDIAVERGFDLLVVDWSAAPVVGELHLPVGNPARLPPPPRSLPVDALPVRWIYHTSGTTSDPKGARHTDSTVMHGAAALIERLDIDDHDVYPVAFPVTHVGGVVILTTFLVTGAHLALFDSFDAATSPARFAAHGATLLGTAVPFFNAYLAAQAKAGDTPLFPKLRACIGGGAPVPTEIHLALERAFGVAGVVGSWGLTEFPNATCARCDDPADVMTGSVGRAGTGVEIRTVDEAGVDVAAGAEGELVLRGPQQLVGYVNPALDEAGFFPDRWFRTGDLGRIDDGGNVWITGRLKDIIIRNAENISVLEIENVLSQHPEVLEATVIGMPDARTGERVCAIVVTRDATHLDLDALRAHCDALGLARHKIPEQIEHLDVLPRNAMGKVLKQQLRAQFV